MNKWLKGFALSALLAISANAQNSHDLLITAEEAVKLLGKPNVVFVSGDSHDVYEAQGHIVGSVEMYAHHLHHSDITGDMHCAPLFMCPEDAKEYIESKGISNDTMIIAYDDYRGPNATGVYAYFRSFGHKNIKILDGGMKQIRVVDPNQRIFDELTEAKKANRDLLKSAKEAKDETKISEYKKVDKELQSKIKDITAKLLIQRGKEKVEKHGHYNIDLAKIDYDFIAGKDEVLNAVHDIKANGAKSHYAIIDTRGIAEIIGDKKLDNVARGGHIPGATFLEWTQIYDKDKLLSFKDFSEIQEIMDKNGITKDKTIYAYCHVGAGRSSHIITVLRMLGYKNAKVYTGSWDEWGNDMNLPITR
jgi:thiosulfate/3-mercaptopyruvate sulfurtransferase